MLLRSYAGIGSRETPIDVQNRMTKIARFLSEKNFVLHSGGAIGADSAFANGADKAKIFLSNIRKLFELSPQYIAEHPNHNLIASIPQKAFDIAKDHHVKWDTLNYYVKCLHARNAQILLDEDLEHPVKFCVCWTPDGKEVGGTGLGLRIAKTFGINVHNLANLKEMREIGKVILL
jgi:hypothetical protein